MKIARFEHSNNISYGIVEDDLIKEISNSPWENWKYTEKYFPIDAVKLLAPIEPPDIFAIGLNYAAHAAEGGRKLPTAPLVFIKASSSVIGPDANIQLPQMAPDEVDYEAELVIVIGKECKNVSEEKALDYVLGYTCGNDVSARDCQFKYDTQFARAKSFETFCPIGPWIETDFNPDNAAISLRLNGKIMQQSNTNDLIFNCKYLISYISQITRLKPGTIIMTGTPSGVGNARDPKVFLI